MYDVGKNSGKLGIQIANEGFINFIDTINHISNEQTLINSIATFLPYYVMLLTTGITVFSGIRYIITNRHLLNIKNIINAYKQRK